MSRVVVCPQCTEPCSDTWMCVRSYKHAYERRLRYGEEIVGDAPQSALRCSGDSGVRRRGRAPCALPTCHIRRVLINFLLLDIYPDTETLITFLIISTRYLTGSGGAGPRAGGGVSASAGRDREASNYTDCHGRIPFSSSKKRTLFWQLMKSQMSQIRGGVGSSVQVCRPWCRVG